MYQFEKIKLIIWDLDETFWKGTLSEGDVVIPDEHVNLLETLTDIGIVNSICSKNDYDSTMEFLKKQELGKHFVFPSINWNPKGARIKQLISDMQLRPANVLFLDDNPSNLGEAQHFCPELMVGTPDLIEILIADAEKAPKKDLQHKRLAQYRVLEEKQQAKEEFNSNEEFLFSSNIQLVIHNDCLEQIERIHDLLLRSNQLNFTKVRSTKEELIELFQNNDIECGYVSVSDNFGDYGIVGFYAVQNNNAIHFAFSCRTLGMGIEQYVYNEIGRPNLNIVGEVISDLSSTEKPKWINNKAGGTKSAQMEIENLEKHQVLIKGPCDLFQIYPYIANTELFDTEFTYTAKNVTIESTGHTTHIVEAKRLSSEQKELILSEIPFTDAGMYCDNIYNYPYKVVVISILTDANLGVYRRKDTGERLAIMEYLHPLTNRDNWDGIISGKYPNSGFGFTKEILEAFSEKYEFMGRNTAEQVVENLKFIRENLSSDCVLAIMLGGEIYYEKNTFEAYEDRHIVHKEFNEKIRNWASEIDNVELIDVNKYIVDQSSFYDHFNHYIKPVYYSLATEIVDIVNKTTGNKIQNTSKAKMALIKIKEFLAPYYYKLRKAFKNG